MARGRMRASPEVRYVHRTQEGEHMTAGQIYDWLIERGVKDPAVMVLGSRHIIGRWERVGEIAEGGGILHAGNVAIVVLGEADAWKRALEQAKVRLDESP